MGEKEEKDKKRVPHNSKDLVQKYAMSLFKKGSHPLSIFGVETTGLKRTEATEIPLVKDMKIDYLFLMEDDLLHHVEFQSTFNKSDIYRFQMYDAMLANKYMDEVNGIRTYIIYPATVREKKNNLSLDYGDLTYNPNVIFLINKDGDEVISRISNRMKKEQSRELTDEEAIELIFSLLMGGDSTVKEKAESIFKIALELKDEDQRTTIVGSVLSLAYKAIGEKVNEIEEVLETMSPLMERIYDEVENNIYAKQVKAKLSKGKTREEIAEALEISVEQVEKVIEDNNLEN